jgi:crotonobetainyl-CoA:carnitine CoA-transferase CaiB-like acyl-CoA transferase
MPRNGPLAGVRVLDLTRLYPGPYATMILADLGADVVKLEDRGTPDYLRQLSRGGQFEALNRGKRSLSIDLKARGAPELVALLCASADVLVEGFRPGVLDRLGCGPAALLARNPRLIVCSISGYGQDGPYAGRAGHDIGYVAVAGVLARNGLGAVPVLPGVQVGDFFGGTQQAVIAILAALLERERTGKGRHLDVAMSEGAMALLLPHFGALAAGEGPQARGEDLLSGSYPCYRVYACKGGGAAVLGALEPKFWERFCAAVARPDWTARQLDRELSADVDELFLSATRDEWVERLAQADCCFEPVLEPVEARAHPQHRARGVFLDSAQMRTLPALGEPAPGRAPGVGEHTVEVLREHGLTEAEIDVLRAAGALG